MTPPREVVQPSSKKVKTETVDAQSDSQDWYSSRQYQRHESTWYNNGNQANDSEEVKEEVGPQALPVEPPPDFSNVTKGKGKGSQQSGLRSGWFNKMAILLCRMQRGEWDQVKLLATAQLGQHVFPFSSFECNHIRTMSHHSLFFLTTLYCQVCQE